MHTDTKITVQHYIQRSELVNPETAALLDRAFARVKAERGAATVAAPSHVGFALNLLHPPVFG